MIVRVIHIKSQNDLLSFQKSSITKANIDIMSIDQYLYFCWYYVNWPVFIFLLIAEDWWLQEVNNTKTQNKHLPLTNEGSSNDVSIRKLFHNTITFHWRSVRNVLIILYNSMKSECFRYDKQSFTMILCAYTRYKQRQAEISKKSSKC